MSIANPKPTHITITPATLAKFRKLENSPRPGIDYHVVAKEKLIRFRFEGASERASSIMTRAMYIQFFLKKEIFLRNFHEYMEEVKMSTHETISNAILDLVCRSIKLPKKVYRDIVKGPTTEPFSKCWKKIRIDRIKCGQGYQVLKKIWRKIFPKPVQGEPAEINSTHCGGEIGKDSGMKEEVEVGKDSGMKEEV
jgi:hypothetical protein